MFTCLSTFFFLYNVLDASMAFVPGLEAEDYSAVVFQVLLSLSCTYQLYVNN